MSRLQLQEDAILLQTKFLKQQLTAFNKLKSAISRELLTLGTGAEPTKDSILLVKSKIFVIIQDHFKVFKLQALQYVSDTYVRGVNNSIRDVAKATGLNESQANIIVKSEQLRTVRAARQMQGSAVVSNLALEDVINLKRDRLIADVNTLLEEMSREVLSGSSS